MKTTSDDQFITDNLERGDWQGDACVELAVKAFDLGVIWPPSSGVYRDTYLVHTALLKLELCKSNSGSLEAFEAGRALERVSARLIEFQKRAKGSQARRRDKKSDTKAFYALMDRYAAEGKPLGRAHALAKIDLERYQARFKLPAFAIPSLADAATHLSRRRQRGS